MQFIDLQNRLRLSRRSLPVPFFALLMTLVAACGNLSGEPRIVATIPPPAEVADNDFASPVSSPNLSNGAQIFAARCTECHGENGQGDGANVRTGAVMNPGDFTDSEFMDGKSPDEYFEIITNGRIENLMPPWGNALTEQERWDVALYVYTLRYTAEMLAEGALIYERECVECHGELGKGDGSEVVESSRDIPDISDAARVSFIGDDAYRVVVAEGAGAAMPAYEDTLTDAEIDAVSAYSRTLSLEVGDVLTNSPAPAEQQPESTPDADAVDAEQPTTQVMGTVTHQNPDADIPSGLTLTLYMLDTLFQERTLTTALNPDNTFVFEDVPVGEGWFYLVSITYRGLNFDSDLFELSADAVHEANITLNEITNDPSGVVISQIVTRITPFGEVLQFDQDVTVTNTSDQVFMSGISLEDGLQASLSLPLPAGAAYVPGQPRFVYDEATFTLYDTEPILPNTSETLSFRYVVPYAGAAIIEYPVEYTTEAFVIVLLETEDLTIRSEQLTFIDPEAVPDVESIAYGGEVSLSPDEVIRFEVVGGIPGIGTSADSSVVTSDNLTPILIVGGVGILIIIAGILFFTGRRPAITDCEIDTLARRIAALERQHEKGDINHDVYQREKAILDRRLTELTQDTEDNG